MRSCCFLFTNSALAAFVTGVFAAEPYREARLPVAARVHDLLGRMTLDEKIDQLIQNGADKFDN
jgi:hypothetical protein